MANTIALPFRISPELDARMKALSDQLRKPKALSDQLRKPKAEVMRMCMELGAAWMEKNGPGSGDPQVVELVAELRKAIAEVRALGGSHHSPAVSYRSERPMALNEGDGSDGGRLPDG